MAVAQKDKSFPMTTPGASVGFPTQAQRSEIIFSAVRCRAVTAQGAKVAAGDETGGAAIKGVEAIGLLPTVGSQAIIFLAYF
jgi:hypothetical protein